MILSVIEKLSSLDQTSTELFRDILVKYGPQLENDNPGKMHILYSRHYFWSGDTNYEFQKLKYIWTPRKILCLLSSFSVFKIWGDKKRNYVQRKTVLISKNYAQIIDRNILSVVLFIGWERAIKQLIKGGQKKNFNQCVLLHCLHYNSSE